MANTKAASSTGNTPWASLMPYAEKQPTASGPAQIPHQFRRVFVWRSCTFMRIIFNVTVDLSFGWSCQIFLGWLWGKSSRMAASFMKPSREDVLDPVYPHGHIRGREARNFSDR